MIQEDYVSFEVAKLLKEKGFDGEWHKHYWGYFPGKEFLTEGSFNPEYDYPAPTLQMAMKWLREVHKIIISFNASFVNSIEPHFGWNIRINSLKSLNDEEHFEPIYINTKSEVFEEACEAAIKYILENLI